MRALAMVKVSRLPILMASLLALTACGGGGGDSTETTGGGGNTTTNTAPTITGSPSGAGTVGISYSFTPSAADANSDPLTFSISGQPTWATFSTASGQLSGTPSAAGSFASIQISVSDGKSSTSLPMFTITVQAAGTANTAPTIAGTPAASIGAGNAYSFAPTTSDANGDALTFSIQNKPSWATFSLSTGQLTGTPTVANVGAHANIIISVTDNRAAAVALAAFTITVTQTGNGTAALTWTLPTQNTDGSALTDLAGFKLYYGTSPSVLSQSAQIAGATQTSYSVSGLNSGTWYFAMTSYNAGNVESDRSGTASKVVL
jgi:hypothetical protein